MALIPFPFSPAARQFTERLEWLTDVLRSQTGAEQRRALRIAPRRSFTAAFVVSGTLRTRMDLLLGVAGASEFALPIWADAQRLSGDLPAGSSSIPCETAGRDFVAGGHALLVTGQGAACELVDVDQVQASSVVLDGVTGNDWPDGALLYPARAARLVQMPQVTRRLDDLAELSCSFELVEPCEWAQTMPLETYLGYPVLDRCLWIAQDLTQSYERIAWRLDNMAGIPRITDGAGRGFDVRQVGMLATTSAGRVEMRELFYALRGRQRPLWLPTKTADLSPVSISGATMNVRACGYPDFGAPNPDKQHIRIETAGGAVCRKIAGAGNVGGVDVLTLDSALAVATKDVQRVCFLALSRLLDDAIEINYEPAAGQSLVATATVTMRSVRHDLEAAP